MIGFSQFRDTVRAQRRLNSHGRQARAVVRLLVSAACVIGATGLLPVVAQQAPTPAPKPVIQAKLSGSPLPAAPGSYCWPQPGKSPCVSVQDPQAKTFVPANPGDVITFSVDPADPGVTMSATFLDDLQADGTPQKVDLTVSQNAYTVNSALSPGNHRIEIDAIYPPMADGSQNFVAYIFGIQVSGPNGPVTAAAGAPTGSPGTAGATSPAAGTGAATLAPTATNAPPTATPSPTETATETFTSTPTVTPSFTPSFTPTFTATNTPTFTLTPTATDTPTYTPTFTPTVTPSVTPTSTGIPLGNGLNVPKLALIVDNKTFDPVAVTASIVDSSGAVITVTRPIDASSPQVRAAAGAIAQLQFSGPKPVSELASLQNGDATVLIAQQVIPPDISTLYTLPAKTGLYTLSIAVQWAQGSATYIYRVQITG